VFQGLSRGWEPIPMRTPAFLDTSVILAIAGIVIFVAATRRLIQVS